MYRHIIWDFDGTLFDSYPSMARGLQKALEECGIAVREEDAYARLKVTVGSALAYYREERGAPEDLKARFYRHRALFEPESCRPFPEVPRLLEAICAAGGRNYLYTHRNHTALEWLERYGLGAYFTECVTKESPAFSQKPDPGAIQYLLTAYGIPPENALMVGDRELDIRSGHGAGIAGCFFDAEGAVLPGAEHCVRRLEELFPLLGIAGDRQQPPGEWKPG